MSDTITEKEFFSLFVNNVPLLDVRSNVEFQRGAFPNSTNIPLLDDQQREAVGKKYKIEGQQAAIDLGNSLLAGAPRQQRLQQWQQYLQVNPGALLYCFRGGLRSHTVRDWLAEAGERITLIEGGYKALRRYLINQLEAAVIACDLLIVAGKTGSAKTHLIAQLTNSIDLEGLARHRGSAFGKRVSPQPGQIDFENNLAIALLKLPYSKFSKIFVEDESRAIGSLSLPPILHDKMSHSPLAVIEENLNTRVDTILYDYIESNHADFVEKDAENGEKIFLEYLLASLQRIRRRLGEENYQQIAVQINRAWQHQIQHGDSSLHRSWIKQLLTDYYDPMYDYQLGKKLSRLVFRGNRSEFLAWSAKIACQNESQTSN